MQTENIVLFLQTAYTDEKLAALLAHAQDGKLCFSSCCCFVGSATATHALQGYLDIDIAEYTFEQRAHLNAARDLPFSWNAETEFFDLGISDAERRERLIPIILAEIERREKLRTPSPETLEESAEMQVVR